MRLPLEGAPALLRATLGAYIASFATGFIASVGHSATVMAAGFIGAGVSGGLYGALLAINYRGSAVYMSAWIRHRQDTAPGLGVGLRSTVSVRLFGLVVTALAPAFFISTSIGSLRSQ